MFDGSFENYFLKLVHFKCGYSESLSDDWIDTTLHLIETEKGGVGRSKFAGWLRLGTFGGWHFKGLRINPFVHDFFIDHDL